MDSVPQSMQSEQLNEFAAALAKAQATFGEVTKDKTAKVDSQKGGYSYRYADLADVLEAVRKQLSANGLALIQRPCPSLGGLALETRLIHQSGQWIGAVYPLPDPSGRPQEMGSAITYARRYSLTALLGIAPDDDDDGAAAEKAHAVKETTTFGAAPACPKCGGKGIPSKFAKPGATHYCPKCNVQGKDGKPKAFTFEPPTPGVDAGMEAIFGRDDAKPEDIADPFGREV